VCLHPRAGGKVMEPSVPLFLSTGVGKSCLMLAACGKPFRRAHMSTLGIEFDTRIVPVGLPRPETGDRHLLKLSIVRGLEGNGGGGRVLGALEGNPCGRWQWDTSGQERFRSITTSFFRGMRGVVLVYDITDPRSFASVESWISEINSKAEKDVSVVLVGNKVDMVSQRRVTTAEGQELATRFSLPFFETSAKTGANLDEVFVGLAETIHKQGPKPRKEKRGARGVAREDEGDDRVELVPSAEKAKPQPQSCCPS
jgi:GTPase SAR1 family protein